MTVVVPEGFGVTFRDGVTSGTRVVLGAAVGASEKKRGMICKRSMSPKVRECRTVFDCGFLGTGFHSLSVELDSGFQSLMGFRIAWAVFRFRSPGFRIPQAKNFPDSIVWIPYMGRTIPG